MIGMHVKIEGDKEIQRKIAELASKFPDKLRGVISKSVLVVEGRAKKTVPVLTGRLRASITNEVKKEGDGYMGKVGTTVEYAPYVEFGTKRSRAKPYLFPAMKESKGDIIRFLNNAIKAVK